MKRIISILILSMVSISAVLCQQAPQVTSGLRKSSQKNDSSINVEKAKEVMLIVSKLLENSHFDNHPINDVVSKKMYDLFIDKIDPGKYLFLSEDILALKKYEKMLDEELLSGIMGLEPESLRLKKIRIEQVEAIYQKILSLPIDISKSVTMIKDPKDMPWCNSIEELNVRWNQIIHQLVVNTYVFMIIEKEQASKAVKKDKDNPADATKKDEPVKEPENEKKLTEEDLGNDNAALGEEKPLIDYEKLSKLPIDEAKLKEAQEKTKKNLDIRFKRLKEEGQIANFNLYMNALCDAFDPHSDYHMPEEKENVDMELTGSLQGIGAQLQENGEEVKVMKIIPGSASWKQKQLKVGDIVQKVGQGSAEPVDIRGMNLNESVRLIRGKKGTEVRLTVKKPDGQIVIIPIIRDVVVLGDSYVHSVVIDDKVTGLKLGYILLPVFYLQQESGNGRSSASDVKKELEALKEKGVQGIIFDLRSNGGGSLDDVIPMAGFFLGNGPIVQVRGQKNARNVYDDPDKSFVYDGPLVVMTSNGSASASEIFAAALQDYGRAVILGLGLTTFGKGTVQTFVPLQKFASNKNFDIGALRLSIQKFYRINGQTTQFKGVIPDISLPEPYMHMDIGEKFLDNPLPADVFLPTAYERLTDGPNISNLKELSKKRTSQNPYLNMVNEYALFLKKRREEKTSNISLEQNFKELEESQKKSQEFKKLKEKKREIKLTPVTIVNDKESGMFKEIETALPSDQYVFEAIDIIKDIKSKPAEEVKK